MEFPVFTLDQFGSGTLVALVAIIHVLISHGAAVGGSVMVAALETWGMRRGDVRIDEFAHRFLKVLFVVTTAVGAMTGVGIWFTTGVVQPAAIGSMLRVFFWFWFTEWVVFVLEVLLVVLYYFTWPKLRGERKALHRNIGIAYAVSSWLTMAIITGILAFMLTPGGWTDTGSRWAAFFNPTYLPSLAFRTFLAWAMAAAFTMAFALLTVRERDFRAEILKFASRFLAVSGLLLFLTGMWYYGAVPGGAKSLIKWATAMTPLQFDLLNYGGIFAIFLFALIAFFYPRQLAGSSRMGRWFAAAASVLVIALAVFYVGEIEMVRESIRKPYVISGYMYANGIRVADVDRLNREGILPNAKFARVSKVEPGRELEAGKEIFRLECQSCHVVNNWIRQRRDLAYRLKGWNENTIYTYVKNLHQARAFMPPFVGTDEELRALSRFLATLPAQTAALPASGQSGR
ncbi:MAG: c-type cytochrome [Alicyclobacillaceae bacterium]|nr:c-type cytochrome [Alicyclobacillaceae bacterium]